MRIVATANGSRPPISRASPSRSTSVRRGALNVRSIASTPSSQTCTWTFSASAVTSARSSELRRSASSSTRSVVPSGIDEVTGRITTLTSEDPLRRRAASPRWSRGFSPGRERPDEAPRRPLDSTGVSGETTRIPSRDASQAAW